MTPPAEAHIPETTLPERAYHADFGPADELDVVLLSSDGVQFCTSSLILKNASSVFRTTLSLPQPPGSVTLQKEIQLSEDAQAIHGILRMISGMEIPALDTFDEIEKTLAAAHKWDMPGPTSIIRRISLPPDVRANPLRFYIMACTFGWEEGAKAASALTNNVDIWKELSRSMLTRLSSDDLLKLLDLRLRRRNGLLGIFQTSEFRLCPHLAAKNVRWEALKLTAYKAMDNCPSEESLFTAIHFGFLQLRGARCSDCSSDCRREVQDSMDCWSELLVKFRALPQTI